MKEKKILASIAMIISLFLWGGGIGYAAISGVCSNCHTMHNSQGGVGEVETYSSGSLVKEGIIPQDQLLKASCIACHTGEITTTATNNHGAPIVLHISNPNGQGKEKTLAGGDFYWVADGLGNLGEADSKGHNVAGISGQDTSISYTPPGWDATATSGGGALGDGQIADGAGTWTTQLTCAGTYGCHGNHSDADADSAISGAHHGNTDGTSTVASSPSTVGNSYRFLGGIKGLENSVWNWDETNAVHNEYYGVDGIITDYGSKDTISYSCTQCHGNFHNNAGTGTSSPWIRHPTDIVLPTTEDKEYQYYNPDGDRSYSLEAPVARGIVPSESTSTVTIGGTGTDGAIVMCLSCHRAHGSPEPDILRWTYSGMTAGIGENDTGCFTCHTTKNAD